MLKNLFVDIGRSSIESRIFRNLKKEKRNKKMLEIDGPSKFLIFVRTVFYFISPKRLTLYRAFWLDLFMYRNKTYIAWTESKQRFQWELCSRRQKKGHTRNVCSSKRKTLRLVTFLRNQMPANVCNQMLKIRSWQCDSFLQLLAKNKLFNVATLIWVTDLKDTLRL